MSGKIILNLAISLDGYIADVDGGFDWIVGDGDPTLNTTPAFDFASFVKDIDVVVMGSTCYEQGMAEPYGDKIVYVATSKPHEDRDNLKFVSGDLLPILQQEVGAGKTVYLFGGGKVIDPFIKADVIDEYIIGIIPTILGNGRRLFLEHNPTLKLHLTDYTFDNGVAMLYYKRR